MINQSTIEIGVTVCSPVVQSSGGDDGIDEQIGDSVVNLIEDIRDFFERVVLSQASRFKGVRLAMQQMLLCLSHTSLSK